MAYAKIINFESLPLISAIKNNEQYKSLITEYERIFVDYVKDIVEKDKNTEARIKCIKLNYKLDELKDKFIKVVNSLSSEKDAEEKWNNLVENMMLNNLSTMTNNSCFRSTKYQYSSEVRELRETIEVYCEESDKLYYDLLDSGITENERCKKYISELMDKMVIYVNSRLWRKHVTYGKKIDEFTISGECDIVHMFDNKFDCAETIISLDVNQGYKIKLVTEDKSKLKDVIVMDPSLHKHKHNYKHINNNINNNNSSNNSNNHSHHNHHHPFPLSVAMLLLVQGISILKNHSYTSLGSLFGIKRKKRYSKIIHKIAVKPAHDKEKKKDISYDSLDVPVRDIEYEYLIRNRDILKGLQTPKKKKSGSKTIVEIHMEVLEECKREEWELIREDFLEIVLQEFMKNESDTCESTSSNDLIGADSHNSDEMYIQKHLWHTWEDEHKHIFDKLKEKTWFHSLKKEWKREQEGLQENELSECDQLNGEQYVPFIERQKCVWGKWVSKQRIRMEQYAEVGWFDKLIEQYQKETNHYVEKATNNTSAPKVNKTKHEADNHESCVLTKKELITKVWMLILMMVLDECKEEDDLQNRELYLDDHIGKCLKKENEETSQDISDLDRNFFERPKKKETDEYKAEMFKNLIEEAIHNKLHKNDQRDDNDVEEEDPMEKYNTDTYMLHLNDDHTNSLNGEDEESFLNGEYINPEGNYHAGSEGDTSLPSEQDQLGEIFNELKSESNELQSDNGMGKTHQMEVTDSDSSSDEDVEGKKYFIYSSMPNSPEKGGDETYATYNG
ncbi:Pvstp1 [Plasmodium vivax India VII]|uniref:Pvstp1 n=1 Tax=Plasmodium vivax India VII TaxID=1077284 RepID=A0A0J9SIE2_PLAVI|nr:Pvstp1 [Plasmodium vivax India VII]